MIRPRTGKTTHHTTWITWCRGTTGAFGGVTGINDWIRLTDLMTCTSSNFNGYVMTLVTLSGTSGWLIFPPIEVGAT
jgi:hypothetical protein